MLNHNQTLYFGQFHMGYSSVVSGMGSWAGIADLCFAEGGFLCMYSPYLISADTLLDDARGLADEGRIDPVEDAADAR